MARGVGAVFSAARRRALTVFPLQPWPGVDDFELFGGAVGLGWKGCDGGEDRHEILKRADRPETCRVRPSFETGILRPVVSRERNPHRRFADP